MPDQQTSEVDSKTENIFQHDNKKKQVFERTMPALRDQIENINRKIDPSKREIAKFGSIFEIMAGHEYREGKEETEEERFLREIFENLYQEAEVYLGTKNSDPSRPDGISIGFNENGDLEINEIIEFKTSVDALEKGMKKEQPQNSLDTIEDLIEMVNKIMNGADYDEIPPRSPSLSRAELAYREFKLIQLIADISDNLPNKKHVQLSEKLTYKVILPQWEVLPSPGEGYMRTRAGNEVSFEVGQSIFSKKDVHAAIEHLEKK